MKVKQGWPRDLQIASSSHARSNILSNVTTLQFTFVQSLTTDFSLQLYQINANTLSPHHERISLWRYGGLGTFLPLCSGSLVLMDRVQGDGMLQSSRDNAYITVLGEAFGLRELRAKVKWEGRHQGSNRLGWRQLQSFQRSHGCRHDVGVYATSKGT